MRPITPAFALVVKPEVCMLYVMAKRSFIDLKRLPEWAEYIRARTRPR